VHVLAVVAVNVLLLALGAGLLPRLGLARTRGELVARLGVGYMVGVVSGAALALYLGLLTGVAGVDLGLGAAGLFVAAVASLADGLRRLPAGPVGRPPLAALLLVPAVVLLVHAWPGFAAHPLTEWDGWVIWGMKARALADLGGVDPAVFANPLYGSAHLDYPLLLPSLEALDLRTMGAFDGTALHVQLLLLLAGFVAAAWSLLRPYVWPSLLALALLAIVATPEVVYQLSTNYADVPLALLASLGVAALASWLVSGDRGLLAAAAIFLVGAALTKNEGTLFAAAALVAAALAGGRSRLRPLAAVAGVLVVAELPWRVWVAAHGIRSQDFTLSNAVDPGYLARNDGRLGPAARQLVSQVAETHWTYLVPLAAAALLAAVLARRFALAGFALAWGVLGWAGLLLVYWIADSPDAGLLANSANRTVDTLVLGAATLAPILVGRVR
jgi:hypothetical protein